MKYYDEFLERMPRSEVEEIEQKVAETETKTVFENETRSNLACN